MKKGFILLTTAIMIFILVSLSVVNFSYVAFASRSIGVYSQRQQLLFDVQSARDKLLYQIKAGQKVTTAYMLGNNRQVTVSRHGSQAEITVVWGELSERLFLKGVGLEGAKVKQWF